MADLQRVSIKVSQQVHEWFKKRSEVTGVSMSSLMYLALEGHIQQQTIMPLLPEMVEELRRKGELENNALPVETVKR